MIKAVEHHKRGFDMSQFIKYYRIIDLTVRASGGYQ